MLVGSYNPVLVIVSLVIAVLASYTALNMAGRVAASRRRAAGFWLAGGSAAMGFGIWSMHFIGMLAFSLPVALGYDLRLTFASLGIAVGSSVFALWLVCRQTLPRLHLGLGALLLGSGIAAMHYTGMAALRMQPGIDYDPLLFCLSVAVAVLASGAALWIAFRLRRDRKGVALTRLWAALVMGGAIVGMHYLGMFAARFPAGSFCGALLNGIEGRWLALGTIGVSLMVFATALIVATLDARSTVLASSLNRANDALLQLALHDSLTNLPNRLLLGDRLEQAIQRATREQRHFAVLFVDLDGFKAVNDAYGHYTGDLLLQAVAERITATKRAEDTAARLGGDEFVLLIDPGNPEDAAVLAQRLVERITLPYTFSRNVVRISASIGIAIYPADGCTPHELMVNADAAMHHAKDLGRYGYCFFATNMTQNAHELLRLQQDLRAALDNGEFSLHYQPKFRAPAGPMTGVEALLRWHSPHHGNVPPDRFLPLAERTGLIVPIGNWVLDQACRQLAAWAAEGHTTLSIAVNLSTVQLAHGGLVQTVCRALGRHGADPRRLVLEVTESSAMRDPEASLAVLHDLTALGVGISIDDFGAGYSSLLYLKRLPAHELKIDRGFVQELGQSSQDEAIVSAIIALGRTLGLSVVAEGVETPAQQALLTQLGCNVLQGYLLGRPVPPAQLQLGAPQGAVTVPGWAGVGG